NPAPYEFFFNLGDGECLVGASPEMYVRVTGDRVETCPIAGTISRGEDPLQDAENIRALLTSVKEESELTMCTDVDRNDKSRVCVPGSVQVIGRRQIEIYSRLMHTVDHIEGRLRPGLDALDAFLTHMWAVTVTGAPKTWAMQFIEDHERTPRRWDGGAAGLPGEGMRVLLVDHQDSFVHTLGGYFREQGAEVTTLRAGLPPQALDGYRPDLVVLSPGPGRPADFGCDALLAELDARG